MSVAATKPNALRWQAARSVEPVPIAKLLPLLREAVAATPDRADLKLQLAKALSRGDRMAEIVDRLAPAIADRDADPELLFHVGRAALASRDYQLALDALRAAVAKTYARAYGYLAETLLRLDRLDEALEAGLQGLQRSPSDSKCLSVAARILLDRREAERLWALCVDVRARGAWGPFIGSAMAYAAAVSGRDEELARLVDPKRWFSAAQLAVPPGFNQALAAEILAYKSLGQSRPANVTRGAAIRIDQFELVAGPLAQDLLARIRAAVESYVAERRVFSDHPIMVQRPESVELRSWALAVHDDGYQNWHIHQYGWISGVYYVEMPTVEPDCDGIPGTIEFGLFGFGQKRENVPSPRWQVTPQSGQLLLFPSYYAHRTWPTGVGDQRVCVAFDICPSVAMPDTE